ncbi:hypothetical protein [Ligilactobacillus acidipiscis]|uniref:hypothetical protein n=1 Tax=Ligilactobacillus acidipiscis TaxID=89059 RepID=UPI000704F3B1|nr:hypothetical protein [Ligilactobacillus acidipiscis]GAW63378.1 hypothetical protein Lacidipiscis_00561 [Ligilactobacillus acidipiscis]GEN19587.1 hypothetical protein LAC02_28680 [Ligilactobacillus acidipiscis]
MANEKPWTIKQRFVHNRNIISKAFATLVFALFIWKGKFQELKGAPAQNNYYVVRHAFDSGLLELIVILTLFGLYVAFSKHHYVKGKVIFLVIGMGIWTGYLALFIYRDYLLSQMFTMQTALVFANAVSFWIDILAGDF